MRSGRRRWLAAVVPAALGVLGVISQPAAASQAGAASAVPGPVVLVGTAGLRWDDVGGDTARLSTLLDNGSAGVIAVRSVRALTCPADGWLAVSAGRRAGDLEQPEGAGCRTIETTGSPGGTATITRWGDYLAQARRDSYDARPGLLGQTLAEAGVAAAAVGPGAALALATPDGHTAHAWPGLGSGAATELASPTGLGADRLGPDVKAALATSSRLIVVDIGDLSDSATADGAALSRDDQAGVLDDRLRAVTDALPDDATVFVASLADSSLVTPHLQLLGVIGPAPAGDRYAASLLGSASTRQDGMVQTTDLMPTLLAALGVRTPALAVGSPVTPAARGGTPVSRLESVIDLDLAAQSVSPIVPWFFNGLVAAQMVLYGVATLVLRLRRTGPRQRRRTLAVLRRVAVVFAGVPAATFLANLLPWWRANVPGLAVTLVVAAFVVPIAALALLGPWRHRLLGPMGAVGAITAAVLAGDVMTGSHLVLSSLMGVQPLVAGRFYGFSNPGFALFATGCLLLATAAADALAGHARRAGLAVAGIGVLAVVIDGTPGLGSDFGGPPALIPAFALLVLFVLGIRLTWRAGALIVAGTLAVLVGLSVLDWLRPAADRTHLGRFVATVLDGGAWPVIRRKAEQNLRILFSSWLSALLPVAVAFVSLVLARPVAWGVRPLQLAYDRSPVLRHGLIAFAVLVGLGFVLNDSGTVIPAVAGTVMMPLLIAVSVRALELDDAERERAAVAAAARPVGRR